MADHFDKFENWSRHPFIMIGLDKQDALGLQFSSVKKEPKKAIGYFDKMILDPMYQDEALQIGTTSFVELWENFLKQVKVNLKQSLRAWRWVQILVTS